MQKIARALPPFFIFEKMLRIEIIAFSVKTNLASFQFIYLAFLAETRYIIKVFYLSAMLHSRETTKAN